MNQTFAPADASASATSEPALLAFAGRLDFLRAHLQPRREIETHASHVFLTATRAWKIRKPLRLPAFDHRSLAARARTCREELRLNRELAGPSVYLGVVPMRQARDGNFGLSQEGTGAADVVDWLVLMRRLPEKHMLDDMLRRGARPSIAQIGALAHRLAIFYRARRGIACKSGAYPLDLRLQAQLNLQHLREMRHHLAVSDLDRLTRDSLHLLDAAGADIARREAEGFVLEGHGDLRPEHICLTRHPVIFDRVESPAQARWIDTGDELDFLAMECALAGAPETGQAIVSRMESLGFPPPPAPMRRACRLFRCLMRARLSIDHLRDLAPRAPETWAPRARSYLALARKVLDAPACGL